MIRAVLSDVLKGQVYNSESAKKWTIQVADEVNARVRGTLRLLSASVCL